MDCSVCHRKFSMFSVPITGSFSHCLRLCPMSIAICLEGLCLCPSSWTSNGTLMELARVICELFWKSPMFRPQYRLIVSLYSRWNCSRSKILSESTQISSSSFFMKVMVSKKPLNDEWISCLTGSFHHLELHHIQSMSYQQSVSRTVLPCHKIHHNRCNFSVIRLWAVRHILQFRASWCHQ